MEKQPNGGWKPILKKALQNKSHDGSANNKKDS